MVAHGKGARAAEALALSLVTVKQRDQAALLADRKALGCGTKWIKQGPMG
jgi:hypothetical protein